MTTLKPQTRSKVRHPVLGIVPKDLPETQLPWESDVLGYFMLIQHQRGKSVPHQEIAQEVTKKILDMWNKSNVVQFRVKYDSQGNPVSSEDEYEGERTNVKKEKSILRRVRKLKESSDKLIKWKREDRGSEFQNLLSARKDKLFDILLIF